MIEQGIGLSRGTLGSRTGSVASSPVRRRSISSAIAATVLIFFAVANIRSRGVVLILIGVVLNQLDLEKAEKYYGEYSGYKSYSGYKKYGYKKFGYGRTYGAD